MMRKWSKENQLNLFQYESKVVIETQMLEDKETRMKEICIKDIWFYKALNKRKTNVETTLQYSYV